MKFTVILLFCIFLFSCTKDKVTEAVTDSNCTDSVSFATEILPLIQNNCTVCHNLGNSTGYVFTNYMNIASNAPAIVGSMNGSGYQLMPQGGPALADSLVQRFQCWVSQGKKNN